MALSVLVTSTKLCLGEVESSRLGSDSGGGSSRCGPVSFGEPPPPGASLNAGSDLPQAKLGGGDPAAKRTTSQSQVYTYLDR